MSGQMTHLNTILVVLAMMTGTAALPVQAAPEDSKCEVTSGTLPLTDINLKSTGYKAGDTLKEIPPLPITYICTVYYDHNDMESLKHQPTLLTTTAFIATVKALDAAGLGISLTIQEDGRSPVTLGWDQIKQTGGNAVRLPFGAPLPMDPHSSPKVTERRGTLSGKIFATLNYQNAPVMIKVQQMTALEIIPVNTLSGVSYTPARGIMTPQFFIRIFPDNLGQVVISPSVVDFGRIYATSPDTLTRTSQPFTVKAEQKTGTTSPFDMPLDIKFDTGGLPLTDNDQAIKLSNGLKLSITDTQTPQEKITFNKTYSMGTIHFLPSTGTGISKTYTAQVEPVPGAVIKTGKFSAAVSVVVTYD